MAPIYIKFDNGFRVWVGDSIYNHDDNSKRKERLPEDQLNKLNLDHFEVDFESKYITAVYEGESKKISFEEFNSLGFRHLGRYFQLLKRQDNTDKILSSGLLADQQLWEQNLDTAIKQELNNPKFIQTVYKEFRSFTNSVLRHNFGL